MGISELLQGAVPLRRAEPPKSDEPDLDPQVDIDLSEEPDEDLLEPDPKPSHRQTTAKTGRARKERPEVRVPATASGKKKIEIQVRDNLTMFLGLGSLMGMRVDPHCFGSLAQQQAAIIDALVPIIMRTPSLLKWFAGSDARYLEYLALAQALAPVAMTVFRHHVVKPKSMAGGDTSVGQPYDLSSFEAPVFA